MRRLVLAAALLIPCVASAQNPVFQSLTTNGPATFGGTLGVTGAATLGGGLNFSGGTNSPGSIYTDTNWGGLIRGHAGGTADIGLETYAGLVGLELIGGSGPTSGYALVPYGGIFGGTKSVVLSGSTTLQQIIQVSGVISGNSTLGGQTSLNLATVGSASDSATVSNTMNMLYAYDYLSAGWSGSRSAMYAETQTEAATTGVGNALVSIASNATTAFNMGGTNATTGAAGAIWGADLVAQASTGATYLSGLTGIEVDIVQQSGSSVKRSIGEQIVHQGAHAVQGLTTDAALVFVDQISATKGWKNAISIGDLGGQWPVDPNGYLIATRYNTNESGIPSLAAGGIDFNSASFTGSGSAGGGYVLRGDGVRINPSTGNGGAVQAGFASLNSTATGASLDTNYKQMTGTPTVAAGGTGFGTGDVATDIYGDAVFVTASGGVVTSVSVIKRGWAVSPPSNPVTFTGATTQLGALGVGLTLNLTWSSATTLDLQPSGGAIQAGSGAFTANGTVATTMTSLGPTGSHTTVQEWFTITDASGVVRYIPAY